MIWLRRVTYDCYLARDLVCYMPQYWSHQFVIAMSPSLFDLTDPHSVDADLARSDHDYNHN